MAAPPATDDIIRHGLRSEARVMTTWLALKQFMRSIVLKEPGNANAFVLEA